MYFYYYLLSFWTAVSNFYWFLCGFFFPITFQKVTDNLSFYRGKELKREDSVVTKNSVAGNIMDPMEFFRGKIEKTMPSHCRYFKYIHIAHTLYRIHIIIYILHSSGLWTLYFIIWTFRYKGYDVTLNHHSVYV